ncbi:chorismate mutase [Candidatus Methylacidiphilum infernorum]|uniref:chorismate mutase n=1 Tax=Candidatus Methylacidiphilum infernorum TaxID=511746 RepID=A0ABX7PWY7_9BACT|nr:chorismate mutase [Candidatus Methylacidiphilum infernorum]QSR87238.1 chorismate mutase [Candidatus Methylacidiphilum infernorum]
MGIEAFRNQLEKIDRQILKFLNLRMKLAQEIGEKKKLYGYPVLDTQREDRYLKNLKAINPGPLQDKNLEGIFREIFSSSRCQQGGLRIGCPQNHFLSCFLASLIRFGSSSTFIPISLDEGSQLQEDKEPEVDTLVVSAPYLLKRIKVNRSTLLSLLPSFSLGGEIDLSQFISHQEIEKHFFFFQKKSIPKENAVYKMVFVVGGSVSYPSVEKWAENQGLKVIFFEDDPQNPQDNVYLLEKTTKEPKNEDIEHSWKKFTEGLGWVILIGSYPF